MNISDLLTWEAIRDLSTCRAVRELDGGVRWTGPEADWAVFYVKWNGVRKESARREPPTTGEIVGTRDAWWDPWRRVLAEQPEPYVLVSNHHDSVITDHAVRALMTPASAVCAWFGVQVAATDPRVIRMPLGTRAETAAVLAKAERRDRDGRDLPLYVNFKRRNRVREALFESFAWATRDHWSVGGTPQYAERLGRARFVLSPPGRSWDCYRTYEALAMGAIPIVIRQPPISEVVAGLPVLVVDDWAEVTPERLAHEWSQPRPMDLTRITAAYWTGRIQAAAAAVKEWRNVPSGERATNGLRQHCGGVGDHDGRTDDQRRGAARADDRGQHREHRGRQ